MGGLILSQTLLTTQQGGLIGTLPPFISLQNLYRIDSIWFLISLIEINSDWSTYTNYTNYTNEGQIRF